MLALVTSVAPHPMEEEITTLMTDMTTTGGLITTPVLGLEEVRECIDHLPKNLYLDLLGTSRILSNNRDAELTCEFPRGSHLISNVVWERVDGGRSGIYNDYRR